MNNRTIKEYASIPEELRHGTEYEEMEIRVEHVKGGMNYFTGNYFQSGYRIAFHPCNRTSGFMSYTIMGSGWENGKAFRVKDAERFNRKELERIAKFFNLQELGRLYAEDKLAEIQEKIKRYELQNANARGAATISQ